VELGAFETLAEFAIAQAGFTSVVVVLRKGADFHPADRFRVFNALVPSIVAGFLSLVPIGLGMFGIREPRVWSIADLLFAIVVASLSWQVRSQIRRLPPDSRAIVSGRVALLNFSVLSVLAVACVLNGTTALFGPTHGGFYFSAIAGLLLVGALAFIRLVFIRPSG